MPPQFHNNLPPVNNQPQLEPSHKHTRLVLLTIVMILVGILAVGYFWYQNEEIVMINEKVNPCDQDGDGDCDNIDKNIAEKSLGQCAGGSSFNALADANHDGCVLLQDIDLLYGKTDQFAGWKTYKNEEYGFEFKNINIEFEFKYPVLIEWKQNIPGGFERKTKELEVIPVKTRPGPQMVADYYKIDYLLTFNNVSGIKISPYANESQLSYNSKEYINYKKLMVGDRSAVQKEDQTKDGIFINTYIFIDSIMFNISYAGENNPEFISLYDQILSTFKFIERRETSLLSIISLTEYGHGAFLVPENIQQGTEVVLRWTNDKSLNSWGNIISICLIGLDEKKQVIELKENKDLCYPDMQMTLGTTTVSSGEYKWFVSNSNKFVTPPKSFKLSLRILDYLPPEGRSEWAGLISESSSNEFKMK